jgi:inosine/xanthosine triphosphatase
MKEIHALVASQNHIKAMAAEDGLRMIFDTAQMIKVELSEQSIVSNVREQPISMKESSEGALHRLSKIRSIGSYTFYIAVEGGIFNVDTPQGSEWFEAACVAAAGPENNQKPAIAYGPAYPIPNNFVSHLREGKDLNQVMEIETGIKEAGKALGFDGWLTDGKLDRQQSSAIAVMLAIAKLKHDGLSL